MSKPDRALDEALRIALDERLQLRGVRDQAQREEIIARILSDLSLDIEQEVARLASPKPAPEIAATAPEKEVRRTSMEEYFLRLSLNLRLQHFIMLSSVLTLIVTGLPLKFHDAKFSHAIIDLLGGINNSAFVHRLGATALIFVGVYHLLYTILSSSGRRDFRLLLPTPKDLRDYIQQLKYFLGKSTSKARFGRFSYIEKFDYWAVYWGMVIMIGSGSLLWFENIVMRFLPKFVLDIAKEAHSDEALLATLAIIIWHFYNVHLNPHKFPMSKIWITGRISHKEMLEEHALEYEEIMRERETKAAINSANERNNPRSKSGKRKEESGGIS